MTNFDELERAAKALDDANRKYVETNRRDSAMRLACNAAYHDFNNVNNPEIILSLISQLRDAESTLHQLRVNVGILPANATMEKINDPG